MVIIGDGPGGYEGALVARQLGADVTLVSAGRIGGSAVLTDCVPSKTLIATSEAIDQAAASGYLGVRIDGRPADRSAFSVDPPPSTSESSSSPTRKVPAFVNTSNRPGSRSSMVGAH